MRDLIERRIVEVAETTARLHGATAKATYIRSYPVTFNHERQTAFAAGVAAEVAGADKVDANIAPLMGGEDFSFMLEARPGAIILLGNGDTAGVHHPLYDFNDRRHPRRRLLLGPPRRDRHAGVSCGAAAGTLSYIFYRRRALRAAGALRSRSRLIHINATRRSEEHRLAMSTTIVCPRCTAIGTASADHVSIEVQYDYAQWRYRCPYASAEGFLTCVAMQPTLRLLLIGTTRSENGPTGQAP